MFKLFWPIFSLGAPGFMTPIRSCLPESTDNRLHDLYRCGSLGMFLVSLLYERKCLIIDLLKINCCLDVSFITLFLSVELDHFWVTVQFMQSVHRASRPHGLFYYGAHFSWHFKQKVCLIRYCVFWPPVRRNLQVFLSLYRANRVIGKVCLQIIFVCGSETGLLVWVRKNTRR